MKTSPEYDSGPGCREVGYPIGGRKNSLGRMAGRPGAARPETCRGELQADSSQATVVVADTVEQSQLMAVWRQHWRC